MTGTIEAAAVLTIALTAGAVEEIASGLSTTRNSTVLVTLHRARWRSFHGADMTLSHAQLWEVKCQC